jgi:galactokinase
MPDMVVSKAHGRVNLIGEHTDYNGGWVLPTIIPQFTEIKIEKTPGQTVTLMSTGDRFYSYALGEEQPQDLWVDYLQGATKILKEKGIHLSGFTASIHSTIPEGSGLSSSAALEMSFLKGLQEMFQFEMTPVELAKIGQRIENEFVGAKVGIMDQMATLLADENEALFLDTQEMTFERIPLPVEMIDLMVINSGISHRLSSTDGGYNERRGQCEEACEKLHIKSLREISPEKLKTISLPDILMKRVRHVVSENARVKSAVSAIRHRNIGQLGKLFAESHASMRDDYQVSIPEIDLLVELCMSEKGIHGARLTGGGFGGSIIAIADKGIKYQAAENIIRTYHKMTGEKGTLLV